MITDQSLATHPSSGCSDFDSVKLEISKDEINSIDYPFLDDCNINPIFLVFIPCVFYESTRTFQTLSKQIELQNPAGRHSPNFGQIALMTARIGGLNSISESREPRNAICL